MKVLRAIIIILVILAALAGGGYLYFESYYDGQINDTSGSENLVDVTIPEGSTSSDIAAILSDKGLLENESIFRLYLRRSGKGAQLKAGDYQFRQNQSLVEITDELIQGAVAKGLRVTVLEGLRYDEVASTLATGFQNQGKTLSAAKIEDIVENPNNYTFSPEVEAFLTENKPADKPLEGFLYPDTYEFAEDADEIGVVDKLLNNFVTRAKELPTPEGYTFYEYLTLASVVQREAFSNEYPEIAGIFIRRLNEGGSLGADATLLYPYKRWKPEPTAPELRADTPYNTRIRAGLTPTPISNPSFAAMQGTWNAEESEYYFFIHGLDGKTYFAKTVGEHNTNIANHL